jgi:hypothetical protein
MRAAIAFAVVSAVAIGQARGDAKQDQALVAKLDALYQPIGKLAGADRVKAACADAKKLFDASDAYSHDKAPAGASVDDATWANAARSLGGELDELVEVCKAPDHKRKLINKIETAEEVVANIDRDIRVVIDAAKPRDVPAAVKKFQSGVRAGGASSKAMCKQQAVLAKQLPALGTAPAGADAAKWKAAVDAVAADLATIKGGCGKPPAADEQMGSAWQDLRTHFFALVFSIPPK